VFSYPYNFGSTNPSKPRVYVLDSSQRPASGMLPSLGWFEVPDYPTCRVDAYGCSTYFIVTISPDAKTLFVSGNAAILVVPVPSVLQTAP
jgi:hypothetical protein